MPKSFDRSLAAVATAEKALANLEAAQIKSIESAIDRSIKKLNADLRKKWTGKGADLFGRDRAILLANDLRDTLNVLNPSSPSTKALLSELQQTIKAASDVGDKFAKDGYIDPSFGASSTASISLEVVRAVAVQAHDMLLNHGTQFAANASIAIQQGVMLGYGVAKTAAMITAIGGITKGRATTIVRTETMRASIDATKKRYASDGVGQVIWIATQDRRTCPRCARNAGRIMPIDQAALPLHPNDRCTVIAYKKEWDEAGLVDHEWLNNHHAEATAKAGEPSELGSKALPPKTKTEEVIKEPRIYELPSNVNQVIKNNHHIKGLTKDQEWEDRKYGFAAGKTDVELAIMEDRVKKGAKGATEVVFTVGGSLDKSEQSDGRTIGLTLARTFRHETAQRPDGYLYRCTAHQDDGNGAAREKAYKSMGFAGHPTKGMYAVVVGGKAVPSDAKGKPLKKDK